MDENTLNNVLGVELAGIALYLIVFTLGFLSVKRTLGIVDDALCLLAGQKLGTCEQSDSFRDTLRFLAFAGMIPFVSLMVRLLMFNVSFANERELKKR